jgi:hypothetical protein
VKFSREGAWTSRAPSYPLSLLTRLHGQTSTNKSLYTLSSTTIAIMARTRGSSRVAPPSRLATSHTSCPRGGPRTDPRYNEPAYILASKQGKRIDNSTYGATTLQESDVPRPPTFREASDLTQQPHYNDIRDTTRSRNETSRPGLPITRSALNASSASHTPSASSTTYPEISPGSSAYSPSNSVDWRLAVPPQLPGILRKSSIRLLRPIRQDVGGAPVEHFPPAPNEEKEQRKARLYEQDIVEEATAKERLLVISMQHNKPAPSWSTTDVSSHKKAVAAANRNRLSPNSSSQQGASSSAPTLPVDCYEEQEVSATQQSDNEFAGDLASHDWGVSPMLF